MAESGSNRNRDTVRPSISPSRSDDKSTGIQYHVLIVEDDESDLFLIQEALQTTQLSVTLHIAADGERATRFFDAVDNDPAEPCPTLVILDINLPKKQGGEVLAHMRQSRRCANASVIAISTSASLRDRERMTSLGADHYFRKPSEYDEYMKLGDIARGLLEAAR